jgi:hypothetical protein
VLRNTFGQWCFLKETLYDVLEEQGKKIEIKPVWKWLLE